MILPIVNKWQLLLLQRHHKEGDRPHPRDREQPTRSRTLASQDRHRTAPRLAQSRTRASRGKAHTDHSRTCGVIFLTQRVMVPLSRAGVPCAARRSKYATNEFQSPLCTVSNVHHARSQQYEALFFVWRAVCPCPQSRTQTARHQSESAPRAETQSKIGEKGRSRQKKSSQGILATI